MPKQSRSQAASANSLRQYRQQNQQRLENKESHTDFNNMLEFEDACSGNGA